MNQGRLWTVVKPSVGLPLFLGAVAVTSVIIHLALLTHTTWLPGYYNGKAKATAALVLPAQTFVLPA
jgi:light-harvesting protein B-800-850 alpha chain